MSPELEPDATSYLQIVIYILRWINVLGWIDIIMDVSLLSLHLALCKEEKLDTAVHVMAYVGQK